MQERSLKFGIAYLIPSHKPHFFMGRSISWKKGSHIKLSSLEGDKKLSSENLPDKGEHLKDHVLFEKGRLYNYLK